MPPWAFSAHASYLVCVEGSSIRVPGRCAGIVFYFRNHLDKRENTDINAISHPYSGLASDR
ncbi:hypothetical protein SERLADRAFT_471352 [Serpula lacrymans var. lacrymans S7.9]|uniref:Uncharacterized protein n=1 Tax=Serpula lacrymans var. lacrymans (strain S7.9) TaxID=578457 RepID=F8P137_SERL9|nr:uncharacterized protein SERLADRAFT_471352 [Serpula lacrymans var. lacrymans S7.9]EGO22868.1 hypothetical protein SERLADRAFT_471352 [Serpula lacrymans var. lacrymans S7.9]